jgi:hypothetical protein
VASGEWQVGRPSLERLADNTCLEAQKIGLPPCFRGHTCSRRRLLTAALLSAQLLLSPPAPSSCARCRKEVAVASGVGR